MIDIAKILDKIECAGNAAKGIQTWSEAHSKASVYVPALVTVARMYLNELNIHNRKKTICKVGVTLMSVKRK